MTVQNKNPARFSRKETQLNTFEKQQMVYILGWFFDIFLYSKFFFKLPYA